MVRLNAGADITGAILVGAAAGTGMSSCSGGRAGKAGTWPLIAASGGAGAVGP